MESFLGTIVSILQLAVAGFMAWGGWLCFRYLFSTAPAAPQAKAHRQVDDFERVASLVLLALLCSTLLAAV